MLSKSLSCLALLISLAYALPSDLMLIEGDILVNPDEAHRVLLGTTKWESGIVPYVINGTAGYSDADIKVITSAMRKMELDTDNRVRFVPRTTEKAYVVIKNGEACYSDIGKRLFQPQTLSLKKPDCIQKRLVIHELMHTLGFLHEQSRWDRDDYIEVQWDNIIEERKPNFVKYAQPISINFNERYDLDSIMHYQWNAFSKNGAATIRPKSADVVKNLLGTGEDMSESDVRKVLKFFNSSSALPKIVNFYTTTIGVIFVFFLLI